MVNRSRCVVFRLNEIQRLRCKKKRNEFCWQRKRECTLEVSRLGFLELCSKHHSSIKIYIEGSRLEDGVGYAAVVSSSKVVEGSVPPVGPGLGL